MSALFSAWGFPTVLYALWLQRRQVKVVEVDQHKQRFERHYIELLKLLRETRNDVKFRHSEDFLIKKSGVDERYLGLEAFRAARNEAQFHILGCDIVEDVKIDQKK